jgi:hypothetical protein
MLFSNKAGDLEGLEDILAERKSQQTQNGKKMGEGMEAVTEMPKQPKYSPVK